VNVSRWARALLVAAAALAAWSVLAAITGGVRYEIGPLLISSRNPLRPLLAAMLLGAIAWRLAYEERLERELRRIGSIPDSASRALVALAAGGVLLLGLAYGVRTAGGADPLGYVSESVLWHRHELRIDQSVARDMPWPRAEETLAPLGYRPAPDPRYMVPTYAPGLPLLMGIAAHATSCGPFIVAPLCGALLVILTWLLGRRFFNPATGLVGALLIASSPVVLYMSMFPMADLPAATFWAGALLAAGPSPGRALASGVLAGVAIAIRPNLVPLAIFPWLLMLASDRCVRTIVVRTLAFAAGILPFVALVAWTNAYLYGSPFESGYGNLAPGFALEHAAANLTRYPAWWLQSQGILAFLFLISLLRLHTTRRSEARVLMAFAAAVFVSYVFYLPFEPWWFLRFLLPAVPLALLFCADAVQWATSRLSVTSRVMALVVFTLATLGHAWMFAARIPLAAVGEGEQKYADAGLFVGRVTPENAVVIATQHSGSIRYYSGRLTLRYDLLDPEWLDRAIAALESSGRPVYLLLDDWELPVFRQRFAGQHALRYVDRAPTAVGRAGELLFYTVNTPPVDLVSPRIPRTNRSDCPTMSDGFVTVGAS
jgi:hypothetical protein